MNGIPTPAVSVTSCSAFAIGAFAELSSPYRTWNRLVSLPYLEASIPRTSRHQSSTAKRQLDLHPYAHTLPSAETAGTASSRRCPEYPPQPQTAGRNRNSVAARTCVHKRTSRTAAPALSSSTTPGSTVTRAPVSLTHTRGASSPFTSTLSRAAGRGRSSCASQRRLPRSRSAPRSSSWCAASAGTDRRGAGLAAISPTVQVASGRPLDGRLVRRDRPA